MDRNKLTSAKSIRSYLDSVIRESLENVKKGKLHQAALDEKDKQDSLAALGGEDEGGNEEGGNDLASALGGAGEEPEGDQEQPTQDPGDDSNDDTEAMAEGDVSFDDIVEKLNTIRSGKSFKDSAVKDAFEKYVDDLDDAERTALFAFLKGIAQIVTGEVPGEKATEPAENPASVQMKKDASAQQAPSKPTQKKTIKPNVIRSPGAQTASKEPQKHAGAKKSSTGAEDTSGPAPIVPKRRGA